MFGPVRSAIFVDFDNVGSEAMRASAANWVDWLERGLFRDGEKKRRFIVKRVYWNGKKDEHRPFFERAGFEAFACRPLAVNKHSSGDKSASDLRLAIHVMDAWRLDRRLKEVFIFSCDTDFVPLVDLLRENDIRVIALGNENDPSSAIYRDHADVVISLRELREAFAYKPAVKPARKVSAPKPKPAAAASTSQSPVDKAADAVVAVAARTPGLPVGRKTLIRALEQVGGLEKTGPNRWFGMGSYELLIAEILKRRPALKRRTAPNGGAHIFWDE